MYELNLENAYDTDAFEKYKEYYVECFREENISEEEEKEISFGYRIRSITYTTQKKGYELYTYKQYLLDARGEEIYYWTLYDNHDFLKFSDVVLHSDGEKYFIFKECLYGYSVLRLSDFKQPLEAPKKMLTCHNLIDPNYENDDLEDVEFKGWNKGELILQTGNGQEFRFSRKDIR